MKVHIVVTDDNGRTFEGEVVLALRGGGNPAKTAKHASRAAKVKAVPVSAQNIDFTQSARAFVLAHGRKMSGPQKFALLVAWIAKGKTDVIVDIQRVQTDWNRMTAPMGGKFNPAYTTRACDKSWTESPKKGSYRLRSTWTGIFAG
ncbi:MAG: hypothetical protein MOGDAGHF_00506 [Rhodocyclaceae bacterium]|jgi:hypothetical protein|nr:hypothetical protein [Rhodocyclaceae bacterium]